MTDVFISYRRAQRAQVEPIKQQLERLGLDVFFDVFGIDGGADFPTVIDQRLKSAKAVLACWSPLYFTQRPQTDWCMVECRYGHSRQMLVPIVIERFDANAPPADLQTLNHFDLIGWRGELRHEGWQLALAALSRRVGYDLQGAAQEADSFAQRKAVFDATPEKVDNLVLACYFKRRDALSRLRVPETIALMLEMPAAAELRALLRVYWRLTQHHAEYVARVMLPPDEKKVLRKYQMFLNEAIPLVLAESTDFQLQLGGKRPALLEYRVVGVRGG